MPTSISLDKLPSLSNTKFKMPLLGWMHRKLRQNSIEPLKKVTIAHPQLDEQQYCRKPTYPWQSIACHKSSIGLKSDRVEDVFEEEPSVNVHELFHGFLAIGTLGAESYITEPNTPKFSISFADATEKETEVTETELKLINDQLDIFLEAEAKEIGIALSQRSSHASIITLSGPSGKETEADDAEEHGDMLSCPLQEYLFGSSLELPDTPADVKREKTSLGELFGINGIAQKHNKENIDQVAEANGKHLIKKILKKLLSSSRKCTSSICGNATNSGSTKRKVPKFLRCFQRKIHPETANTKVRKSQRYETCTSHNGGHWNEDATFQCNDKTTFLRNTMSKEEAASFKESSKLSNSQSTEKWENWITTDADFFVLEL